MMMMMMTTMTTTTTTTTTIMNLSILNHFQRRRTEIKVGEGRGETNNKIGHSIFVVFGNFSYLEIVDIPLDSK